MRIFRRAMAMNTVKSYSELAQLETFEERYEYLKTNSKIGAETFGFGRWVNQDFYHRDPDYRKARREVILRDRGLDLGIEGRPIGGRIIVHHINPITEKDILEHSPLAYDPEYMISVSDTTHNAIHFGSIDTLPKDPVERRPGDTCPWRK